MKFAILVFPGSNCDLDAYYLVKDVLKHEAYYVRYDQQDLDRCDALILPGGFSYGDYLRSGAIARFSPVMEAVQEFAEQGGLVFGICNGFQVLTEAGLLPGALYRNQSLQFRCRQVFLRVENGDTPYTGSAARGDVLKIPVAHGDGCYYAPPDVLKQMEENRQILLRYCDAKGEITEEANPNGSSDNIAGVCNKRGNVAGMMPHPERAGEAVLGSEDGLVIFESICHYMEQF
ncbi:MAG: phosphoribosylformylglycinamidine synthase subunit PurQ [Bacillota bacterium]|nr:phosphoribosylformylglycinamidine synthase subunit PurQ [Bacillota bacterium]